MRQKASHGPVVVAAVLFFLCMPDGIPFLYAVCSSPGVAGTPAPGGVNQCGSCITSNFIELYNVEDCTLSFHGTRCEITATVVLDINQTNCKVNWFTTCGSEECGLWEAATGEFDGEVSATVGCNGSEVMTIQLGFPEGNCQTCNPTVVFSASATCQPS